MHPSGFNIPAAMVVMILAAACHGPPSDSKASSSAEAPPSASATATPRMKEFDETPAPRLGTLPPDVGVPVGQPVPNAIVRDADGHDVQLQDLIKKGPILLAFYRGGWCPYCNFEIHELTTAYPEYQKRGVLPVAISVDKQEEAAKIRATYTIPFPVLSDPELSAHQAFHVIHHADDAEVARLKANGVDLEKSSGKEHHSIAIPALFLIDKSGVVRWAHADPEFKVRPRTRQILAAIDAAKLDAK